MQRFIGSTVQGIYPPALWLMKVTVFSRECESMMVKYVIIWLGMHVATEELFLFLYHFFGEAGSFNKTWFDPDRGHLKPSVQSLMIARQHPDLDLS